MAGTAKVLNANGNCIAEVTTEQRIALLALDELRKLLSVEFDYMFEPWERIEITIER